jgi:sulfite reductase alpha subunit-like flavoprotein
LGLCSGYLRTQEAGSHLWVAVRPSTMETPKAEVPVVMVGIGSGVAPMVSMLRDRAAAAAAGHQVAPMLLYFGNR